MNAFVNGEASDFAQVVVGVSPYRANTTWAEGEAFWVSTVDFVKTIFAIHGFYRLRTKSFPNA